VYCIKYLKIIILLEKTNNNNNNKLQAKKEAVALISRGVMAGSPDSGVSKLSSIFCFNKMINILIIASSTRTYRQLNYLEPKKTKQYVE
jgi:hypothetical protein